MAYQIKCRNAAIIAFIIWCILMLTGGNAQVKGWSLLIAIGCLLLYETPALPKWKPEVVLFVYSLAVAAGHFVAFWFPANFLDDLCITAALQFLDSFWVALYIAGCILIRWIIRLSKGTLRESSLTFRILFFITAILLTCELILSELAGGHIIAELDWVMPESIGYFCIAGFKVLPIFFLLFLGAALVERGRKKSSVTESNREMNEKA